MDNFDEEEIDRKIVNDTGEHFQCLGLIKKGLFEGMNKGDICILILDENNTRVNENYCRSFCFSEGCKYYNCHQNEEGDNVSICRVESNAKENWNKFLKEQQTRAEKEHLKIEVKS
jgi:hypothetical protein